MKQIIALALAVLGMAVGVRAQEVLEAGPGVTLPLVIREVHPNYTPDAKKARIEGNVLLTAVVQPSGAVADARVERSLDPVFGLDQEAVKALSQWTFKAGTKDGKPVAVRVHVEMHFTLK
jgi:periplasmic protein TonB